MNDVEKLRKLSVKVVDSDRPKLDIVYNEVLYPRMVRCAEILKKNELSIGSYTNNDTHNKIVAEQFGGNGNLQNLVETKMKPYLEEKGFKVVICSPSYYVYIRW